MAEATDIEKAVGDLELAVDRLRSLYEQYFMGIEKLEPMVPRKDVDRRIHVLRKEQIRNTAQRFRFQMILQRYNTYQTHWMRICREIENGTYKRHVIRAQQRFGNGLMRRSTRPPPPAPVSEDFLDGAGRPAGLPPIRRTAELEAELAELDKEFAPADELDDIDVELVEEPRKPIPVAPRAMTGPPLPPPSSPAPIWRKATAAPSPPSVAPPIPALRPPPTSTALRAAPPTSPTAPPPFPNSTTLRAAPPRPTAAPAPPSTTLRTTPVGRPTAGPPPSSTAFRTGPIRPTASPPRSPDDLPDDRVRALYSQYVDAKRRQNESTAAITYEAVAKSLRDSSAKLREKHGRPVDFEVAVKDGKAILKPVLK